MGRPIPPLSQASSTTLYRAGRPRWWHRGPTGRPPRRPGPRRRRRAWLTWTLVTLLVLVALVVAGGAWLYVSAGRQLQHVDALGEYAGRPAAGKGTNWLLVGTDSRTALTPEQRDELHVGNNEVQNTDTIMVLHSGEHGPTLVSLPRDSYVPIPGHGSRKINEAYADGGPQLLTRTVEQATGLRIDRYAEVNFLGFVQVVDALDGVRLCLDAPLKDEKSGADFPAGCRRMNGAEALAFVRARYADPEGDLGRVKRQRQLLGAVAEEMAAPSVLLDPDRFQRVLDTSLAALVVDDGADMARVLDMGWSMKQIAGGGGTATTVPVNRPGVMVSGVGSVLAWNESGARELFGALRHDDRIPTSGTK
ncbi:LCP family protein [Streptomyces lydicamycinicus]|uniref:Putative LysR family transcriptional regulator n=1 Tax=Streptomyces lydicamycinicus TaxID=1546107 RepID=A0A0P4R9T7_9ACTN|nr:LCP family protein [Streptomyces lydicamycinicus]USA02849.1 LCP family protein [Streptomyces lydicamycinicus]GAO09724.1 putative LysR family transcriptional regulator [Streptomyces lydicamycinicus]